MVGPYSYDLEIEFQIQIGSTMFPEYTVRSAAQAFYELKKALGIASSSFHSISQNKSQ